MVFRRKVLVGSAEVPGACPRKELSELSGRCESGPILFWPLTGLPHEPSSVCSAISVSPFAEPNLALCHLLLEDSRTVSLPYFYSRATVPGVSLQ